MNRVVESKDETCRSVTVPCLRMSAVCRELGVEPDFVKIDVEGHERAVLEGLGNAAHSQGDLATARFVTEKGNGLRNGDLIKLEQEEDEEPPPAAEKKD